MNKLSKDQKQKISLSTLMLLVLVYCYFNFLLAPKNKEERVSLAKIEELDAKLDKAKSLIKRGKSVQDQSTTAGETLAQIDDKIPEGAPVAWFPPQIHAFFDRHNIKDSTTRSGATDAPAESSLAVYKNWNWSIELPQTTADQLGIALAGLENENILLEITRLQINTQPDNPEKQRVSLNVVTLLK